MAGVVLRVAVCGPLNQREYELTKQISLLRVNPLALLQLHPTDRFIVTLPEALFDTDGLGHYSRHRALTELPNARRGKLKYVARRRRG